ncbi:unnamed protein product [Prorocentrum cordatum]|uniref:PUM-HD domain-containing protein n=1 Tax=Prorocentrum cordatum TaxID=2364126 RepID=A0ABN9PXD1_9DINO|nr:unnamed protein product [Polarella glacialis]
MDGPAMAAPACPTPFPGHSLHRRLRQLPDAPAWAAYLPAGLYPGGLPSPTGKAPSAGSTASRGTVSSAACGCRGRVWALSRDPAGCREVQQAFDLAAEEERVALARELRGHVHEAMRCPHANYVLQKALSSLQPEQLDFVVEELGSKGPVGIVQAARHKYGCRIVQRLLEHGGGAQADRVAEALCADALENCLHPYGNYAIQKVLQHSDPARRRALVGLLREHVAALGEDAYGSSVLTKALACGARDEQLLLVRAMLATPGLLAQMPRRRGGNISARLALKLLEGKELEEAKRQLDGPYHTTGGGRATTPRGARQGRGHRRAPPRSRGIHCMQSGLKTECALVRL